MIVKRIKQWRANRRFKKERMVVALENIGIVLSDVQRVLQGLDQTFTEITNQYYTDSSKALLTRSLSPQGIIVSTCMSCHQAHIGRPLQCSQCGEANNFYDSPLR